MHVSFSRPLTLTALVLALAAPAAHAQNPANYEVDTNSSRVYTLVTRTNRLGHDHGVEGKLASGKLTAGGAGQLVFDMTSFTVDTAQARQYVGLAGDVSASDARKANDNMRGPEVLDVGRFPQASFAVTSMLPADNQAAGAAGRYIIDGTFTLHGVAQQVRFAAELAATNQAGVLTLRGRFGIRQTDYGIKPFTAGAGLIGINDSLTIYGDLLLKAPR